MIVLIDSKRKGRQKNFLSKSLEKQISVCLFWNSVLSTEFGISLHSENLHSLKIYKPCLVTEKMGENRNETNVLDLHLLIFRYQKTVSKRLHLTD